MSCNDKIKQRCKKVPAGCVNFEADLPVFSSLIEEECISIEEVALDLYDIIGGIKEELALEEITSTCITLPLAIDNKKLFQIMMDKICELQERIQTLEENEITQNSTIAEIDGGNCPSTPPKPVTTLSSGAITSTTVQLIFTAPTGSANAIDYYECWANGVKRNNITASGQTTTGLATGTSYNIFIIAVDTFNKKSVVSNVININTI